MRTRGRERPDHVGVTWAAWVVESSLTSLPLQQEPSEVRPPSVYTQGLWVN